MGYREVTVLEIKAVLLQWLDGADKKLARRQSIDVKVQSARWHFATSSRQP